tara:strand:- start:922 stop:1725 length:804 start_codon:yes stop_codon:yes gene_type:complete
VTNEEKTEQWLVGLNRGVEIGAFQSPLPNIKPIYVDTFKEFAGQKCLVDVLAESTNLPFSDHEMDYVAASHVFEHIANPLQALLEWFRVTRHDGIIYLVIPDRNHTWERNRPAVSPEHLLSDYYDSTSQSDGTHIDEFVDYVLWNDFSPDDPSEEARESYRSSLHGAIRQGLDINIHFHAYDPSSFAPIVDAANELLKDGETLELVDFSPNFPSECPNGFLAVLRVAKPPAEVPRLSWVERIRNWFRQDDLIEEGTVPVSPKQSSSN